MIHREKADIECICYKWSWETMHLMQIWTKAHEKKINIKINDF